MVLGIMEMAKEYETQKLMPILYMVGLIKITILAKKRIPALMEDPIKNLILLHTTTATKEDFKK
tara:strand:+ start:48 stop:239 length:192 start_codon:yes stop_codon:yes gene_type:complete